jgi:hypothetical protein
MNNKDNKSIYESYSNSDGRLIPLVNDLLLQKKEHYPESSDHDLFDVSIEDLQSEFSDKGDSQAVSVLDQLQLKDVANFRNPPIRERGVRCGGCKYFKEESQVDGNGSCSNLNIKCHTFSVCDLYKKNPNILSMR